MLKTQLKRKKPHWRKSDQILLAKKLKSDQIQSKNRPAEKKDPNQSEEKM